MRTLYRHLAFRPHDNRLLTSSAAFWLFSARILVFVMATAEAAAWGYLGFVFSEGFIRWITAGIVGAAIFLVVWMIDVSLITMDRAWPEHAKAILGETTARSRRQFPESVTFLLRVGLLVGSLTITAPYLAQLVFYRDIERFNTNVTAARIDSTRANLIEHFNISVLDKQNEVNGRRADYEKEIAGQGPSRRFGAGPTAAAIGNTIAKLEAELNELKEQREDDLSRFETIAGDPRGNRDRLATLYNLILPEQTILGNYAALQELRKRPEHRQTELAIKAFLAFIFFGLLLLKLFEPYSVRLYFSEVLQQEYSRYLAGTFDAALPPTERSEANGRTQQPVMSPQRFYNFLAGIWAPSRLLEEKQARDKAQITAAVSALGNIERMREVAFDEFTKRSQDVGRLTKARDDVKFEIAQIKSAIAVVGADAENFELKLKTLITRPDSLDDLNWREHRTELTKRLTEARRVARELEERLPSFISHSERSENELEEALKWLRISRHELEAVDREIRAIREMLATSTSADVRSALKVI
ncbi:MAG: hypothetical protein WEE89_14420 [Gemmatimonadota bacterium]